MERYRSGRRRRYWPRSRAAGCLLWIILLIVLLIVLSVLFGGFQKGTQYKGLGSVRFGGLVVATA
jgi:cytochrome c-type biogenesis protein CcmH/NrfF